MKVIKRNGIKTDIEFDEITRKIKFLANKEPVLNIDAISLAREVIALIYDGISTSELDEFTASTAAGMSLYNPDYGELASRLIINNHQKNTLNSFCESVEILKDLIHEDIIYLCHLYKEQLDNIINHERDYLISYFGFNTLLKSYLLKNNNKTIERPQYLFLRVSLFIHSNSKNLNIDKVKNTYNLLSQKYFTHATPTLYSAGTKFPQMSSCYLMGTEDTVLQIYKTITDVAMISKWAGGVGIHISNIRAAGAEISKTNGISQGLMPMLKVYNDTARYINQSSKRNGSFAMYLEPWHADIFTFLDAKKNNGADELRARDLFYALWIPDLFIERLKNKEKWSLMCPKTCPGLTEVYGKEFEELYCKYESEQKYVKQIDILQLWNSIINSQIETGIPYMCYKDSINRKSNQKNIGIIKSSNLCVEIMEKSDSKETAVCNLASICLPQFVKSIDLHGSKIVVYSKSECKYCDLAKDLLKNYNLTYTEISLNNDNDRIMFYEKYTDEESGLLVNSMPQIFINGILIGGYTALNEYLRPVFQFEKLEHIVDTVVENLNIIINKNYYPTDESKFSNLQHRPIGIGVQGLADVFMLMKIPFTSDLAKKLNKDIFESIYYYALKSSCKLAQKYGTYSTFKGSPTSQGILQFDLWKVVPNKFSIIEWNNLKENIINYGLRNSLLIALMPTASTAQIMGNNESFEPYTSNIYTRRVLSGEYLILNKYLMTYLKHINLLNKDTINSIILSGGSVQHLNIPESAKEIFKTVWEISQKSLIEMSADRGAYVDQSQSFNVFVEKASPQIINSIHLYGYSLGLKTGSYYVRTKPTLSSQNFSMDYSMEKKLKSKESNSEPEPCLMCSG